jgi:hypothetical protein
MLVPLPCSMGAAKIVDRSYSALMLSTYPVNSTPAAERHAGASGAPSQRPTNRSRAFGIRLSTFGYSPINRPPYSAPSQPPTAIK